jgi:hypothetical protein
VALDVAGSPTVIKRTPARLVPHVVCGAALAGTAAYIAANDPAAAGSRFPACGFRAATGLWCPGCGLTRGTHQLLNGDVAAAVSYNVFTPIVVGLIVVAWAAWTARAVGRRVPTVADVMPRWGMTALVCVLLVYGVARNLPVEPMRALAP